MYGRVTTISLGVLLSSIIFLIYETAAQSIIYDSFESFNNNLNIFAHCLWLIASIAIIFMYGLSSNASKKLFKKHTFLNVAIALMLLLGWLFHFFFFFF